MRILTQERGREKLRGALPGLVHVHLGMGGVGRHLPLEVLACIRQNIAPKEGLVKRVWQQHWDLVIVDEAHKCSAYTKKSSSRGDDLDDAERDLLADEFTSAVELNQLRSEIAALQELLARARRVRESGNDSKLEALRKCLERAEFREDEPRINANERESQHESARA